MKLKRRVLNVLISVDQLAHVLLTLGKANPDETISSAAWRLERRGKLAGRILRPLIDWLFSPWGPNHCELAYLAEIRCDFCPSKSVG